MTKFYAIIKEKNENSNCFRFFSSDSYSSKKDFISDLRANGYVVIADSQKSQYDRICDEAIKDYTELLADF